MAAAIAGENRRFHGRRCHLGCGANTAKLTVKIEGNRDFDAR